MRRLRFEPVMPSDRPPADIAAGIVASVPNGASVESEVHAVIVGQQALYTRTGAAPPWIGYLAIDADSGDLVGSCSFIVGDPGGSVEIAYFTFPPFEGEGVATAMAGKLLAIATEAGQSDLHAFTLPEENASTAVLEKHGFARVGEAMDEDAGAVSRWEREGSA